MHDAGFERLEELFHSALALPPAERADFLREHCGDDVALRQELEEMLRADAAMLDIPVLEQLGGESLEGQEAGRWQIGELIGEGGLGVVYAAVDAETGERAAIKFLRPGLDAGAFRRRFLKERRILGALEHPHIARWLDGGVDVAGRPYLVMEFVDGQPLDHYLSATKPGGVERLDLLAQVCEAVQYLHGALVAHGDLKPSNVLVSGDGQVKLLDFGAAKLLMPNDSNGGQETTMTRAFLTPHYASPEQKQGEGPSVASDIYALGVILGDAFPAADSDLGAIRDMCCRPEANERYRSALELDQDLRRYRAKMPVRARRQDMVYKSAKFLQRHVLGVGLTAAVVAALATGGFFVWREVQRDRERLAQMRGVVRTVLQNAPAGVVNGSDDRRAVQGSMETAIRELESSGEKGMELELAAAWRKVGAARLETGDTPGGVEALRRAYELAEQRWQARREPAAFESKAITLPLWALALRSRREGPESLALAKRAVAMHEEYKKVFGKPLGPENPIYRLILILGPALARQGEIDEGRRLLQEALATARMVHSNEYTGRALIELAVVEERAENLEQAKAHCEEAARTAPLAPRLKDVCGERISDAMPPAEQIAALRERISGKRDELRHDPDRFQSLRKLAMMHQQLARLLYEQGRKDEARAEIAKASEYFDELALRDPGNVPVRKQAEKARRRLELLSK